MKKEYLHPEVTIVHWLPEQRILSGSNGHGEDPNPVNGGDDFWGD